MKRVTLCLLAVVIIGSILTGCRENKHYDPDISVNGIPDTEDANTDDVNPDDNGSSHIVTDSTTDTFTYESGSVTNSKGEKIGEGNQSATAPLNKGENYQVDDSDKKDIKYTPKVLNAAEATQDTFMPYQNRFGRQIIETESLSSADPLTPCEVTYSKRDGGKYIYCNNPEKLSDKDIGQALLREKNMSGMYEFTFEHSNWSSGPVFLGYQLLNDGDTDAYVTVYNIGYQVKGEWLGQQSWSDFYNLRFELPDDYFVNGKLNWPYKGVDFINYTPRIFKPTTYRIPAGEYIYVLGGTSKDAANNTNVANTANLPLGKVNCVNGAVKFNVTGGHITGTFYAYNNPKQVKANPPEQGYIVKRDGENYGAQYKGVDSHLGLIESNLMWTVNDSSPSGRLPVKYKVSYDSSSTSSKVPYKQYNNRIHTLNSDNWLTALNPQNEHTAIGTDMMTFHCIDTKGNSIVIDNDHADGTGDIANTGNWMVQYNDNYTLVNSGDKERTFKVYTKGSTSGALMVAVRDKNGKVMSAKLKAQPSIYSDNLPAGISPSNYKKIGNTYWALINGIPYCDIADEKALVHTVTIAPHSYVQFTVDYLNMGNSCGGIGHWVVVD